MVERGGVPAEDLSNDELVDHLAQDVSYLLQLLHSATVNHQLGKGAWERYGKAFGDQAYRVDTLLGEIERRGLELTIQIGMGYALPF